MPSRKHVLPFVLVIILFTAAVFSRELHTFLVRFFPAFRYGLFLSILFGSICALYLAFFLYLKKVEASEKSFIDVVNHVFRTPLTRMKWFNTELASDTTTRETRLLMLQQSTNSLDQVMQIVDVLAGIADVHSTAGYNFTAVSIREIVEEALSRSRESIVKKNIKLSVPTFEQAPFLTVDTKKISYAMHIIVSNAVMYTAQEGSIAIGYLVKSKSLTLIVEDSGLGITWTEKRHLFQRFYRSPRARAMNTDGLGLDLYLAREIVKRHGGTLRAKSKGKGKGSAFLLTLPMK